MKNATDFVSENAEYLIYSSRLGIEFTNQNGVMVVDKTYTYDVDDDIKALLKYNNAVHGKLTKASVSLWLESNAQRKLELRRKVRKYNSDYRVINNSSISVVGDRNSGVGVAIAVAVPSHGASYPEAHVATVIPTSVSPLPRSAQISSFSAASSTKVRINFISDLFCA